MTRRTAAADLDMADLLTEGTVGRQPIRSDAPVRASFRVSPSDPAGPAGARGAGRRWWADARPPPSSRHPAQARARLRSDRRIRCIGTPAGSSRPSRTASARAIRSSSSGNCRQRSGVAHQFPAARRGDPAGVADAQVPGMRFADGGQRADDGGGVGVDERQRRHRVMGAPGPAAATGNIHAREVIARQSQVVAGHAQRREVPIHNRYDRSSWPIPAVPGVAVDPAVRRVTPRPRDARSAAAADGPGLAQPRGAIRHGGAGGLRADRATLAAAADRTGCRGRRDSADRAEGSGECAVAAGSGGRRADRAGPADPGGGRRSR